MAHPRDHSLAIGAANHLRNEGHIDDSTHKRIVDESRRALGHRLPPFGSLAGAGHYYAGAVGQEDDGGSNAGG